MVTFSESESYTADGYNAYSGTELRPEGKRLLSGTLFRCVHRAERCTRTPCHTCPCTDSPNGQQLHSCLCRDLSQLAATSLSDSGQGLPRHDPKKDSGGSEFEKAQGSDRPQSSRLRGRHARLGAGRDRHLSLRLPGPRVNAKAFSASLMCCLCVFLYCIHGVL